MKHVLRKKDQEIKVDVDIGDLIIVYLSSAVFYYFVIGDFEHGCYPVISLEGSPRLPYFYLDNLFYVPKFEIIKP